VGTGYGGIRVAEGEESFTAAASGAGPALLAAAFACAAAVAMSERPAAKVLIAGVAIVGTAVSGIFRATAELARRRSRVPVLQRAREVRHLAMPYDVAPSVDTVEQELWAIGFTVDRVERSHDAWVVLASRAARAFFGSMLMHLGVVVTLGALAAGPLGRIGWVTATGAVVFALGSWLRVAFDPHVVWCVARGAGEGTTLEIVVSGRWFPSRVAECADALAGRIAGRVSQVDRPQR
jgi:hypothetical protein